MRTISKLFLVSAALLFAGAGCVQNSSPNGPDGGMFRSTDEGLTWVSKSTLLTATGQTASFAAADVNVIAVDPSDSKAMWIGSLANGIFYTFDSGESWQRATNFAPAELELTNSIINSIAVDPKESCVVYAAITSPSGKSSLIRTSNCGRNWGLLYSFNEFEKTQLRSIAINPRNPKQLFLGDTSGNIFRSDNGGGSWKNMTRIDDRAVRTIVIHPNGAVFAGTSRAGLRMSFDGGESWEQANLKAYPGSEEVYVIALDPSKPNRLLIGTKYGILRSDDLGKTWTAFDLLTAPKETQILSLAVNPTNSNRIYYGTPSGFYRSEDGGVTWTTKRLPTTRIPKTINIDIAKAADGKLVETIWVGAWGSPN